MNHRDKIIVTKATIEFPMCPTAVVGTTGHGATVRVRYRWGRLSIRVDTRNPAPNGGAEGYKIFERKVDPEGLAGWITYDEIREITADIITRPDQLSRKTYDESDIIDL